MAAERGWRWGRWEPIWLRQRGRGCRGVCCDACHLRPRCRSEFAVRSSGCRRSSGGVLRSDGEAGEAGGGGRGVPAWRQEAAGNGASAPLVAMVTRPALSAPPPLSLHQHQSHRFSLKIHPAQPPATPPPSPHPSLHPTTLWARVEADTFHPQRRTLSLQISASEVHFSPAAGSPSPPLRVSHFPFPSRRPRLGLH